MKTVALFHAKLNLTFDLQLFDSQGLRYMPDVSDAVRKLVATRFASNHCLVTHALGYPVLILNSKISLSYEPQLADVAIDKANLNFTVTRFKKSGKYYTEEPLCSRCSITPSGIVLIDEVAKQLSTAARQTIMQYFRTRCATQYLLAQIRLSQLKFIQT